MPATIIQTHYCGDGIYNFMCSDCKHHLRVDNRLTDYVRVDMNKMIGKHPDTFPIQHCWWCGEKFTTYQIKGQ